MQYEDNSFATGYALGQNTSGYNNNGMFGNDAWWIIILLIFGWNGNGGFGNNGSNMAGYELGKLATTNDIASGFSTSAIMSNINDILLGQSNIQQTLCQGFGGVNTAISNNGYETRLAVNDLGYRLQDCCCKTQNQIQSCCCDIERGIEGVNYNMAKNTCDIIRSGQDNTQRILDFLTTDKIATLQSENQTLKFQASQSAQNAFITANQEAQTAELIRRLGRDCPVPAFVVPNPNCCYDYSRRCSVVQ